MQGSILKRVQRSFGKENDSPYVLSNTMGTQGGSNSSTPSQKRVRFLSPTKDSMTLEANPSHSRKQAISGTLVNTTLISDNTDEEEDFQSPLVRRSLSHKLEDVHVTSDKNIENVPVEENIIHEKKEKSFVKVNQFLNIFYPY